MSWVYGHYQLYSLSMGTDFRRHILTSNIDPRAVRVNYYVENMCYHLYYDVQKWLVTVFNTMIKYNSTHSYEQKTHTWNYMYYISVKMWTDLNTNRISDYVSGHLLTLRRVSLTNRNNNKLYEQIYFFWSNKTFLIPWKHYLLCQLLSM